MKKNVLILTIAAILLLATVAMANSSLVLEPIFEESTNFAYVQEASSDSAHKISGDLPQQKIVAFSHFVETSINTLDKQIKSNDFEVTDQKRIKNRFINTIADYRMTLDELELINSFIEEDYNVETLLEIYEFLRWTNSDITMIPKIYNAIEQERNEDFWIYDTYDHLLSRTDDMLSVEDVAYYVASGLTINEIAGAYELSFAGVKTTKQMLNERLDGSTWNSICAEIISNESHIIKNAPEMTIDDILKYRNLSVKMRKDVSEIITIENGTISISDNILSDMNDTLEIKQTFIKKFDAEIPAVKPENKTDYTAKSNIIASTNKAEEYIYEEDYIPVEEPEVE